MIEYVIIGDTERFKDCLVAVCKKMSKEQVEEVLHRMLTNPTEHDLRLMENHTNFRIAEVKEEQQWWNDPYYMSD